MAEYIGKFTGAEIDRLLGRIDTMADTAEGVADSTARTVAQEIGAAAAKAKIDEYIPQLDNKVAAAQTAKVGAESARGAAKIIKDDVDKTASDLMYSLLHVQKAPPLEYLDTAITLVSPTLAML